MSIQFLRGSQASIDAYVGDDGQPAFTKDTHRLYVYYLGVKYQIGGVGSIGLGEITYDLIQDVSADTILGREGTDGEVQELAIGAGLNLSGGILSAAAYTFTPTATVTLTEIGGVVTADVVDGSIATAKIADQAVTYAKIQNVTAGVLLGRNPSTGGDVEEITLGTTLALTGTVLDVVGSGGGGDHGDLSGLLDDDHPQYVAWEGRTGGQRIYGGINSGENLTLNSNQSFDGLIVLASGTTGRSSVVDEDTGRVGIATAAFVPDATFEVHGLTGVPIAIFAFGDGTPAVTVLESGQLTLRVTTAPSSADLVDSEVGLYWDDTNGQVKARGKLSDSTVVDRTLGAPSFAQEAPSGTINGSNTDFTLAHTPVSAPALLLFKNGLAQTQGSGNDYTVTGSTITFETGAVPQTGDTLLAWYTF